MEESTYVICAKPNLFLVGGFQSPTKAQQWIDSLDTDSVGRVNFTVYDPKSSAETELLLFSDDLIIIPESEFII
jgi:hypothetical protein